MGYVIGIEELKSVRQKLKQEKKKVVFTNGCFDIIHRGHIDYLTKAKALGDVLVVGLNTDASVRRIKGEHRPIVDEDDRAQILACLSPVDYVCLFGEDTPYALISAIIPDVLIKGADWNVNDIVGKDIVEGHGGTVATITFLPNRSTSNIIQRIVERYA